jgi:hypothetical protein
VNAKEAADIIGCSASHVRTLIRTKVLKAKRLPVTTNRHGYILDISLADAEQVRDRPITGVGWKRGKSRN